MRYYIGLDNGGTLTKGVLFDEFGKEVYSSSRKISLIAKKPLHVERDMNEIWEMNSEVIKDITANSGVDKDSICAISFSGHGKGLYWVDEAGNPVANSVLSTDNRACEYPVEWKKNGIADKIRAMTLQDQVACQLLPLIKWYDDNEPELLEKTKWLFGINDYLRFCMTGAAYAEITNFSGSSVVNLITANYDKKIFELVGLEKYFDKLPPLIYSSEIAGEIKPEIADQLGLKRDCKIAAGMFDIDACAIAMNVADDEYMAVIGGTWSINEYVSKVPVNSPNISKNSIFCIDGMYLVEESSPTSASNNEWFLNTFFKGKIKDENVNIYEWMNEQVSKAEVCNNGLIFLPYLYGSNFNAYAKASFIGMDVQTDLNDICRAVYEGVAFCHKVHIERLLSTKSDFKAIRMAGGVVKSPIWMQIFADVLNTPIEVVDISEMGAYGAALSAMVADGLYPSLKEAGEKLVEIKAKYTPNSENVKILEDKYKTYLKFSTALDSVWE